MIVIQTTVSRRAMTALARVNRKTLRRGRSLPVRTLAGFVVALEVFLTALYLRAGRPDWPVNALLGLFMLGCLLLEDQVSGAAALRRIPPEGRVVNATFQEDGHFVLRTQAGEDWWPYFQIKAAAETEDYFFLFPDRNHGQVYDKKGFSWGTQEEFRALIQRRTGLKIQKFS